MTDAGRIAANLEMIEEKIAAAAIRAGRSRSDIILIAVSKTVPVERIREAIGAGLTHFGENRVQEARERFAERNAEGSPGTVSRNGITLHLIGSLQRNKAPAAAAFFDTIQSVDRPEIVDVLNVAAGQERPAERLPVLVQVNVTGESSKFGVAPEGLPALLERLRGCASLRGEGLMTIAREDAGTRELHETFAALRRLLEASGQYYPGMTHLSMGMSDDYEVAAEEGATMLRIGRAIFGERDNPFSRPGR